MAVQAECIKLVQLLVQDLSAEERNRHRTAFLHFCQSSVVSTRIITLNTENVAIKCVSRAQKQR